MKSNYIYPVRPADWTEDGGLFTGSFLPGQNTTPFFMSDVEGQVADQRQSYLSAGVFSTWTTGQAPSAGGPQSGYYRMGAGARVKYVGAASEIEIECFATTTGWNTVIAVWVWDGTTFSQLSTPPCDNLGYNTWRLPLPIGYAKNVEIIQSSQWPAFQQIVNRPFNPGNETTPPFAATTWQENAGYPPLGAYVTKIGFNVPMTSVPPPSPAHHLLCEVDSNGIGGLVNCQAGAGVCGLMKRGQSVQPSGPIVSTNAATTYSSSTAYTPGQFVNYGVWVWKCILAGTNQTPAVGSSYWSLWGYNGAVTVIGYGFKMVADDWSTTGAANAAAAARAALGGTAMWWATSRNDWFWSPSATFSANFARALAAMYAAQPALPIFCMGMLQSGNPEAASPHTSVTPATIRSAMAAAVAAASGSVAYASGAAWVAPNQYEASCTNLITWASQQTLMNALQPYITT